MQGWLRTWVLWLITSLVCVSVLVVLWESVICSLLNLLGRPEIRIQSFLSLDLLPTKAVKLNLSGLISEFLLLNELPSKAYDPHLASYFPIAGARMISARACPHATWPTHCMLRDPLQFCLRPYVPVYVHCLEETLKEFW